MCLVNEHILVLFEDAEKVNVYGRHNHVGLLVVDAVGETVVKSFFICDCRLQVARHSNPGPTIYTYVPAS